MYVRLVSFCSVFEHVVHNLIRFARIGIRQQSGKSLFSIIKDHKND